MMRLETIFDILIPDYLKPWSSMSIDRSIIFSHHTWKITNQEEKFGRHVPTYSFSSSDRRYRALQLRLLHIPTLGMNVWVCTYMEVSSDSPFAAGTRAASSSGRSSNSGCGGLPKCPSLFERDPCILKSWMTEIRKKNTQHHRQRVNLIFPGYMMIYT